MSREEHLVELVDADGRATGSATVAVAHAAPGRLHRAFSVLLIRDDGRILLQRRSSTKTRFALHWANSCCGHPAPGEDVLAAAGRRLAEELGMTGIALRQAGVYVYRAADATTGRVEHEYDHVLIGRVGGAMTLAPDTREVAQVRWADPAHLTGNSIPGPLAPWLPGVVRTAAPAMGG
ncbi:isopentenyl-diphosphate Delta-isomerase [Hamadaea tsunoensis]|uniref:isopentenyl-diphosphate Delta-isomerase n=1 Tax=Hamadaea tsunoensis TaxID=53368 RepID=UPI0004058824|nr:isopentenyl-diphosphate Delta-isomerase [Hamadaea tsunoensis]